MIKLKDIISEAETFTAINKDTGKVSVFKSKDSRDAAIKGGTHDKKAEKGGDSSAGKKDKPKVNIFDKPKKKEDDPKKDDEILVIYKNKRGSNKSKKFTDKETAQKFADKVDGELGKIVNGRLKTFPKTSIISKGEEPNVDEPKKDSSEKAPRDEKNKIVVPKELELKGDRFNDDWYQKTFAWVKSKEEQDVINTLIKKSSPQVVDKIATRGLSGSQIRDGEHSQKFIDTIKKHIEKKKDEPKKETTMRLKSMLPESIINEGTRSQVGIIDRSGKIASAYVHFDGYPSNMKPGLKKHMKNEKDVLTLIKKGGARGIFNDKDIEYYNEKSQPIKGNFKDIEKYIKSADQRGGAEYVYLYNMKDRKWYYADTYKDTKLKKLF